MAGCCNGKNNAQYVPLSRTITINGVTFDLRSDREWVITTEGVVWGAIAGDISDQADLIGMLTDLANDINAEASARASGDTSTLNAAKAYSDSLVVSAFRPGGSWDASQGSWPTQTAGGEPLDGSFIFNVSAPGIIAGIHFDAGDNFYNLIPNPGQTLANWSRFEYNTQQATESERGTARIAQQSDVSNQNSTNDTDFITPFKFWAAAKTTLFTITEFASNVSAVAISGLTGDSTPIANGNPLNVMLSSLQNQFNNLVGNIEPDKLIKLAEPLSGSPQPLTRGSDSLFAQVSSNGWQFEQNLEVIQGKYIIMYTEPGNTKVKIYVNDSFDVIAEPI